MAGNSSTRAKNKYRGANYDILYTVAARGKKPFYKAASGSSSLSDFAITAIEEKMKKEKPELLEAMEKQDAARKAAEAAVGDSKTFSAIQEAVDKETGYTEWDGIYRAVERAALGGVTFAGVESMADIRSRLSV